MIIGPIDSDMNLSIDGRNVGDFKIKRSTTNLGQQIELAGILEGYHTLRIAGRNIADWKREVQVHGGESVVITPRFQVAVVNLVVKSEPGARIYIDGMMVGKTSGTGEVRIPESVKPGAHIIRVEKDGFNPREETAIFNTGNAVIELSLDPAGGTTTTGVIEGRIVDLMSGSVAGATVLVINEDTGLERSMITDSNGSVFFSVLPPGNYKVTVSKKGYLDTSITGFRVLLSKTSFLIPPITLRPATGTTQPSVKSKKPGSK